MKTSIKVAAVSTALNLLALNAFADAPRPAPVKMERTQAVEVKKETTIQDIRRSVMPSLLRPAKETVEHRVGNGGEELEIDLKKRSLQIAHFINSTMGKKTFNMLNSEALIEVVNSMDIDITSNEVLDRYNTSRTCINEPERKLITCNEQKITSLLKREDVLTATLFHEILGLMKLELGYQDNVSMYPISSMLLPYHAIVKSTPITEKQVRPEFYGLDHRSYGVTFKNKKTKETVRLICLNDNVEVHRCRNYSLVRMGNNMQAPLVPDVISLSPSDLVRLPLNNVKLHDIHKALKKMNELKNQGFKFITIGGSFKACEDRTTYRYGFGFYQYASDNGDQCMPVDYFAGVIFTAGTGPVIDTVAEGIKQGINATIYPIKAAINGIRYWSLNKRVNKLNDKIALAKEVINSENDLMMIGTSRSLSDKDYKVVIEILSQAVKSIKQQ